MAALTEVVDSRGQAPTGAWTATPGQRLEAVTARDSPYRSRPSNRRPTIPLHRPQQRTCSLVDYYCTSTPLRCSTREAVRADDGGTWPAWPSLALAGPRWPRWPPPLHHLRRVIAGHPYPPVAIGPRHPKVCFFPFPKPCLHTDTVTHRRRPHPQIHDYNTLENRSRETASCTRLRRPSAFPGLRDRPPTERYRLCADPQCLHSPCAFCSERPLEPGERQFARWGSGSVLLFRSPPHVGVCHWRFTNTTAKRPRSAHTRTRRRSRRR